MLDAMRPMPPDPILCPACLPNSRLSTDRRWKPSYTMWPASSLRTGVLQYSSMSSRSLWNLVRPVRPLPRAAALPELEGNVACEEPAFELSQGIEGIFAALEAGGHRKYQWKRCSDRDDTLHAGPRVGSRCGLSVRPSIRRGAGQEEKTLPLGRFGGTIDVSKDTSRPPFEQITIAIICTAPESTPPRMNTGDGGVTVGLGIGNRQLPKHEPTVLSTEKGTGRGASSSFHWISAMPPDRVEWLGRRRSP